MSNTPNVRAPEWAASEASPWLNHNKALRIFDAFAVAVIVEEMDLTAPPGSCADGARYIVSSPATGAWLGHEGALAISVGTDASNGWYFATVALEGMLLRNRATSSNFRYTSGAWVEFADTLTRLQDMLDVDLTGLADGMMLRWDASNGVFYAVDIEEVLKQIAAEAEWTLNWSSDGDVYIAAPVAMTVDQGNAEIGTGDLAYAKSTGAAPGTFGGPISLPITLDAGAWLKVSATGVSGFKATHLRRAA